jgi:hypothetical protein
LYKILRNLALYKNNESLQGTQGVFPQNLICQNSVSFLSEKVFSLEVALYYKLNKNGTDQPFEGEARAVLDEKTLTLIVSMADPLQFNYIDMKEINEYDYKINISMDSEKLFLERLGYQYEDFLFQLFKLRNDLLLKYLLMEETLIQDQFYGQYEATGSNLKGNCEIRLYDTALVVLPQKAEPIRLPYSYISKIDKGDYKLTVANEFGEDYTFSMLGEKFDPLAKALSDAYAKMMRRTQESIKDFVPETNTASLSRLASLMKDGRAAQKAKIDLLNPDFWARLTKKVTEAGLAKEYSFLASRAPNDQICVGVKQGLMGELTGKYTWLLFPLNNAQSNRLSNTVALEAFLTKDSKQPAFSVEKPEDQSGQDNNEDVAVSAVGATYFFRLMNRKQYAQVNDEDAAKLLSDFIINFNKCMIDINFRREPIFLTESQLENPKYAQYRYAVSKMSGLKMLREHFIGRVIHGSIEQWMNDVNNLLTFNSKSLDDSEKWKKGDS